MGWMGQLCLSVLAKWGKEFQSTLIHVAGRIVFESGLANVKWTFKR